MLVGLFVPMTNVQAQNGPTPQPNPGQTNQTPPTSPNTPTGGTQTNPAPGPNPGTSGPGSPCPNPLPDGTCGAAQSTTATAAPDAKDTLFGTCSPSDRQFTIESCTVRVLYIIFFQLPAYVLWLTAYLFNASIPLTLGTALYENNFLPEAWRIVRDFSNIFFILVLLYIAIKMILGIGGADIKKMVVNVIIAALLINFSMFMTRLVIDSSNILALIFYNKITVNPAQTSTESTTPYFATLNESKTGIVEKDIAGGIVKGFDVTQFLSPDALVQKTNKNPTNTADSSVKSTVIGATVGTLFSPGLGTIAGGYVGYFASSTAGGVPTGILVTIIFTACAVFLLASYAFLVAGFAFFGRLIELWILIIFSPFAFMSFSIPDLKKVKFLGWDAWFERLIGTAFMAPIFMFFLLLISKLVQINILGGATNEKTASTLAHAMLILVIPAIIYLTMLYKATEYAKEHSGEFGKMAIKYGKMVAGIAGGLALTAASGGATLAIGAGAGNLLNAAGKKRGDTFLGNRLMDAGKFLQGRSFDFRNVKALGIGDSLTKAGLGKGKIEGGWAEIKKKQVEKRQKRGEELNKRWSAGKEAETQNAENEITRHVMETKVDMYTIDKTGAKVPAFGGQKIPMKLALEEYDKQMDKVRKEIQDLRNAGKNVEAEALHDNQLKEIKNQKETLRTTNYTNSSGRNVNVKKLEEERNIIKSEAESVSYEVRNRYATSLEKGLSKNMGITKNILLGAAGIGGTILTGGVIGGAIGAGLATGYSPSADNEAARKIRANIKVDSGEKAH